MSNDSERSIAPQSVTRVLQILDVLSAAERPVGLAELSRTLNTPKSSLAALLRGLVESGFVIASDSTYRLGARAFGLGSALVEARRRLQTSDIIREGMHNLNLRSGETVLFAVQDDDDAGTMTYVDMVESRTAIRFSVKIGDRRPLYCTAGGRFFRHAPTTTCGATSTRRGSTGWHLTRKPTGQSSCRRFCAPARSMWQGRPMRPPKA